jgi:aspartate-semialdehyde dehydrogenase
MRLKIAVGGATGNVGGEMLKTLASRNFPCESISVLASERSAGTDILFKGKSLKVKNIATFDFAGTDILFLSTGAANARETAPRAAASGCVVIDNSSAFRMDPDVPLVVPEVNPHDLAQWHVKRILPVANCSTIQLVVALKPLHDAAGLRRVVVSTYQSAGGGGRGLVTRLSHESNPAEGNMRALYTQAARASELGSDKPIAFNAVPHIDVFLEDGRTKEEWKMEVESRRILNLPGLPVAATCVRVPVFTSHSESVNVELQRALTAADARAILEAAEGVSVFDEQRMGGYVTPLDATGTDPVWISRIRQDRSVANGLAFWVVADNVRKGAALNAVQIAEALIAEKSWLKQRQGA